MNIIKFDFSNADELCSLPWVPVTHMIASCYNYWDQYLDYSGLILVMGDRLPVKINSANDLETQFKNDQQTVYTLMAFDKGVLSDVLSGIGNFTNLIKVIEEENLWKH